MIICKITYRGWPGHFILGDRCRFRLNTLIEYGQKRIVVSTVGLLVDRPANQFEPIGNDRYYETMAFWATLIKDEWGEFWEADVTQPIDFDSPWRWPSIKDELKAQAGHEVVVQEIAGKLKEGIL